ncbi:hypothetical protein GCM10027194_27520 [Thalassiella azotivora]
MQRPGRRQRPGGERDADDEEHAERQRVPERALGAVDAPEQLVGQRHDLAAGASLGGRPQVLREEPRLDQREHRLHDRERDHDRGDLAPSLVVERTGHEQRRQTGHGDQREGHQAAGPLAQERRGGQGTEQEHRQHRPAGEVATRRREGAEGPEDGGAGQHQHEQPAVPDARDRYRQEHRRRRRRHDDPARARGACEGDRCERRPDDPGDEQERRRGSGVGAAHESRGHHHRRHHGPPGGTPADADLLPTRPPGRRVLRRVRARTRRLVTGRGRVPAGGGVGAHRRGRRSSRRPSGRRYSW